MANLEIELKSPSFSNTKMVPRLGTRSANSMTCYNRYPTLSKFPFLNLQKPVSFHVLSPLALLSPQFTPHSAVSLSLSLLPNPSPLHVPILPSHNPHFPFKATPFLAKYSINCSPQKPQITLGFSYLQQCPGPLSYSQRQNRYTSRREQYLVPQETELGFWRRPEGKLRS